MGITAKVLQLKEISASNIGCGGIRPLLQQRNGLGDHPFLFAVQQRHQPELTFCSLRFALNPTPSQGSMAERLGLMIPCKSSGITTPDLTAELIQQQHKSEAARGVVSPILKITVQPLLHHISKAIADEGIESIAATKPLPRTALLEPEMENVVSGQDEQL